MVQFLKEVFGAKGEYEQNRASELRIGDSLIMVGGTLERMPTMSFLYIYVEGAAAVKANLRFRISIKLRM